MFELLGSLLVLAGAVFLFSAGLGVLRMPDTYNRIQTGTKATTLGTMLVLVGIAFLAKGHSLLAQQHYVWRRARWD